MGVFLYFGITSILNPGEYSTLLPAWTDSLGNPDTLVQIHGGVEILCALAILFGVGGAWPYGVLLLAFLGVLMSVQGTLLVRDMGILGGVLLLLHVHYRRLTTKPA